MVLARENNSIVLVAVVSVLLLLLVVEKCEMCNVFLKAKVGF